jgi:hypothetical protein
VALFVFLLVSIVVAVTWVDWRDTRNRAAIPDWAKGLALAGAAATLLASGTSYASLWMEGRAQLSSAATSSAFWPEAGVLLLILGTVVAAARTKRRRSMVVLGGIIGTALIVAFALFR